MNIAIYGYGNLGKGVELAVKQNEDMELFGVFTRRNPESLKTLTGIKAYSSNPFIGLNLITDVFKHNGKCSFLII